MKMQNINSINSHNANNKRYSNDQQRENKMSQVSVRNGYWFYFDHEGNDISLCGSIFTGKEKVFFNNKEVSSFRNMNSTKSEHSFEKNGHCYVLKTHQTSILKGEVVVSLFCDDELVQSETLSQMSIIKSFFVFGFISSVIMTVALYFLFVR